MGAPEIIAINPGHINWNRVSDTIHGIFEGLTSCETSKELRDKERAKAMEDLLYHIRLIDCLAAFETAREAR